METFPSFLLVSDHGVAFYMVNDLGLYGSSGSAYGKFSAGIHQEGLQVDLIARIAFQARYVQGLVFFHFELLTGNFYNGYHNFLFILNYCNTGSTRVVPGGQR